MFFGVDVEIIYTKKDVLELLRKEGNRYESVKFLTNTELFQQFAIKIISELPIKTQNIYKFVHPTNVYRFGSKIRGNC